VPKTLGFETLDAVAINPVDGILYGIISMESPPSESYFVAFNSSALGYILKVDAFNTSAGAFTDVGDYMYNDLSDGLYVIRGVANAPVYSSKGSAQYWRADVNYPGRYVGADGAVAAAAAVSAPHAISSTREHIFQDLVTVAVAPITVTCEDDVEHEPLLSALPSAGASVLVLCPASCPSGGAIYATKGGDDVIIGFVGGAWSYTVDSKVCNAGKHQTGQDGGTFIVTRGHPIDGASATGFTSILANGVRSQSYPGAYDTYIIATTMSGMTSDATEYAFGLDPVVNGVLGGVQLFEVGWYWSQPMMYWVNQSSVLNIRMQSCANAVDYGWGAGTTQWTTLVSI
jgi:hypothetical protein